MRHMFLAALMLIAAAGAATAEDKEKPAGAAKGAAVGAVAGHEVGGGHAVAGAATGAAVGHHQAKKAEKENAKSK